MYSKVHVIFYWSLYLSCHYTKNTAIMRKRLTINCEYIACHVMKLFFNELLQVNRFVSVYDGCLVPIFLNKETLPIKMKINKCPHETFTLNLPRNRINVHQ